jgi:hypothetical protein
MTRNPSILEAFKALKVKRCNTEVGSKIIQGLQRQMHRERVKLTKYRGVTNGS